MEFRNDISVSKKEWITPLVEVISMDVIQAGNTPGAESATIGPGLTGQPS